MAQLYARRMPRDGSAQCSRIVTTTFRIFRIGIVDRYNVRLVSLQPTLFANAGVVRQPAFEATGSRS